MGKTASHLNQFTKVMAISVINLMRERNRGIIKGILCQHFAHACQVILPSCIGKQAVVADTMKA